MRFTLPAGVVKRLLDLLQVADGPSAALAGAGAGNIDNGAHYYAVTFVDAAGETAVGALSEVVTVADKTVDGKIALSGIPIGPPGTTSRKVYRTAAGGSTLKLQSTIANNTATTLTDNTADSGLGAEAPTVNSSHLRSQLGMYNDLVIEVPVGSANTDSIYMDVNNPNVSAVNFGKQLDPGSSYRFAGQTQPVAAAHIYLFTPTAAQRFNIVGQEI